MDNYFPLSGVTNVGGAKKKDRETREKLSFFHTPLPLSSSEKIFFKRGGVG